MDCRQSLPCPENSLPASVTNSRNVVIFGETGSGKSSTVNMFFNAKVAAASDSALGCTFQSQCYSTSRNGCKFNIYDTIGLNECDQGTVNAEDAIKNLIDLIQSLNDGLHLLIMCIRKGRISDATLANYRLFYEVIVGRCVPIILVVTHCEHDDPITKWKIENEDILRACHSMNFKEILCITTLNEGRYAAIYEQQYCWSQFDLNDAISRCSLEKPLIIRICAQSLLTFVKTVINHIAGFLKLPKIPLNRALYKSFRPFCSSDAEAIAKSNEAAEKINWMIRGNLLKPGNRRANPAASYVGRENIELLQVGNGNLDGEQIQHEHQPSP